MGGVTNGEETALEGVCFIISRQILMHHYGLDMHIEWCKAQARANQWFEEVELLLEEMRRTLLFFQWDVTRWEERGDSTAAIDEDMLEGHLAYAQRQAHIRNHLAENCHCFWSPTMEIVKKLDCEWQASDENRRNTLMSKMEKLVSNETTKEDVVDQLVMST